MSDRIGIEDGQTSETTRRVLAISSDVRNAVTDVARSASRSLSIFTQDLEPEVYDRIEFLDCIKNLILTHKFARVRILLKDPLRTTKEGHRLVELARRFSTFIEVRIVQADYGQHREAFLLADQSGLVYRIDASRWEGIADTNSPRITQRYMEFFDRVWDVSSVAQELRALHI